MSAWVYKNAVVDELPQWCVGFVYVITNLDTGRMYIGKKLAQFSRTKYKTVTLKSGIKKKKKVKSSIGSGWETYYGSSPELLSDIDQIGVDRFSREILYFCSSKSECSYLECREQIDRRVLESLDYYNANIMMKTHKMHILDKIQINKI